ncbi:MAG: RNA-dependent DNA polymerase [Anaerolineales bacterium]|nr:RNA-dependent DNA polymerase [Anaerolineales bacterium]
MNVQERMCAWGNLMLAYQNASRGKRGRGATAAFETLLADNLLELQNELQTQTYQPSGYTSFYIHEPKKRLISAAPFRDRVVHHALCNVTVPYFEKLFIPDSYANQRGKGTHRALDRCTQFARRFKYVLPCDVRQFFPSIDHAVLQETLASMLPDPSVMWLVDKILASGRGVLSEEYEMVYFPNDDPSTGSGQGLLAAQRPRGLPIGNLTSQWWANCYLNPFDQFVKRELGCQGYLRYVDDFLLFSDSKDELMNWREKLLKRLERFRLTLHEGSAYPKPVTEGIPFLGFQIFPDHRRLKPRKGYAFRRKLSHVLKFSPQEKINATVRGWINHVRYGDTFGLRRSMLHEFNVLAKENRYG